MNWPEWVLAFILMSVLLALFSGKYLAEQHREERDLMIHSDCRRPHLKADWRKNRDPSQPKRERRFRCTTCGWQGSWSNPDER